MFCCRPREPAYEFVVGNKDIQEGKQNDLVVVTDALPQLNGKKSRRPKKKALFDWIKPRNASLDIQPVNPQKRGALSFIKPPSAANPFSSLFGSRNSLYKSRAKPSMVVREESLLSEEEPTPLANQHSLNQSESEEFDSLDSSNSQTNMFSQKGGIKKGFKLEALLEGGSMDVLTPSDTDNILKPSPNAAKRKLVPVSMLDRDNI